MSPIAKLFNLLPILALLSVALNGVESVPGALAHGPHRVRDNHKHLAARHQAEAGIAAQQKKRGTTPANRIVRRADGSQCRVRGATTSASSSAAASSTTTTSTATPSSTAVVVSTETLASSSVNLDAGNAYVAPSSAAYVAPAASSAPASSYTAPSTGGGSGWANSGSKYGLAWPNGDWSSAGASDYIGNYIGSKASWYYTWSPHNVGSGDSLGLEFVPMLWGPHQTADWWATKDSWPSTTKNALFFNEPNEASQCNMAAGDSVTYWMNDYLPVVKAKGLAPGTAATTSAPNGLEWVLAFRQACTDYGNSYADCTPSFVPLHWYDVSASAFQTYVSNFHEKTGLDIWITEYACQNFNGGAQCSSDETWALHQQMAAWFETQDYVKRFAPFGVMKSMQGVNQDNALMNPDGSETALGAWYQSSA